MLAKNGVEMRDFEALLDFGCGCGRVIRQWRSLAGTDLHGTDYNPYLIEWCRRHLPFASFTTNDLSPSLSYEDETFDFVYAISIFTHLDEPLQVPWMSELRRVTKPGGFLLVTLNGASKLERLGEDQLGAEQRQRFAAGELVVLRAHLPGTTACAAFHPERDYVRRHWPSISRLST